MSTMPAAAEHAHDDAEGSKYKTAPRRSFVERGLAPERLADPKQVVDSGRTRNANSAALDESGAEEQGGEVAASGAKRTGGVARLLDRAAELVQRRGAGDDDEEADDPGPCPAPVHDVDPLVAEVAPA